MATKKKQETTGKKIVVRQTRSKIGRNKEVRNTLCALGLGNIGDTCEHVASPSVLGMIRRVHSIVEVIS
ncbi:MAG: 50S ribosomal protein L30 [Deltaproteobacteria bacterium]|nr:50S ribosomal protein L30 [Deltaproteobacteria bacterium]